MERLASPNGQRTNTTNAISNSNVSTAKTPAPKPMQPQSTSLARTELSRKCPNPQSSVLLGARASAVVTTGNLDPKTEQSLKTLGENKAVVNTYQRETKKEFNTLAPLMRGVKRKLDGTEPQTSGRKRVRISIEEAIKRLEDSAKALEACKDADSFAEDDLEAVRKKCEELKETLAERQAGRGQKGVISQSQAPLPAVQAPDKNKPVAKSGGDPLPPKSNDGDLDLDAPFEDLAMQLDGDPSKLEGGNNIPPLSTFESTNGQHLSHLNGRRLPSISPINRAGRKPAALLQQAAPQLMQVDNQPVPSSKVENNIQQNKDDDLDELLKELEEVGQLNLPNENKQHGNTTDIENLDVDAFLLGLEVNDPPQENHNSDDDISISEDDEFTETPNSPSPNPSQFDGPPPPSDAPPPPPPSDAPPPPARPTKPLPERAPSPRGHVARQNATPGKTTRQPKPLPKSPTGLKPQGSKNSIAKAKARTIKIPANLTSKSLEQSQLLKNFFDKGQNLFDLALEASLVSFEAESWEELIAISSLTRMINSNWQSLIPASSSQMNSGRGEASEVTIKSDNTNVIRLRECFKQIDSNIKALESKEVKDKVKGRDELNKALADYVAALKGLKDAYENGSDPLLKSLKDCGLI